MAETAAKAKKSHFTCCPTMAEAEHQDAAGARKRTTSFADDQSKTGGVKFVRREIEAW